MSNILVSVITAVVAALLATGIFILVQVILKKRQRVVSDKEKTNMPCKKETHIYDEVVDLKPFHNPACSRGESSGADDMKILQNEAYEGFFLGKK